MNLSQNVNFEDLFRPVLQQMRERIRIELEKKALELVRDELARYALDLSAFASFQRMGTDLVITVRQTATKGGK